MNDGRVVVGQRFFENFLKSLWESPDAFVRELISNAHAAIMRRAYEDPEGYGDRQPVPPTAEIKVNVHRSGSGGTIIIEDNGIGISREIMEGKLSQLGESVTAQQRDEYLNRSEPLTDTEKEQLNSLIGFWGIGLYSGLTVAREIQVISRAFGSDETHIWTCQRDSTTSVVLADAESSRDEPGTSVILNDFDNDEFLDESRLRDAVVHYSDFFPYPVRVGGATANRRNIPWDGQRPSDVGINEFYRSRWPQKNPPLTNEFFDIDMPIDARGVLYLCDGAANDGLTLLVQRVPLHQRVSLLPSWAEEIVCGVIEADLPLSPSRELPKSDSQELTQLRKILKKRLFKMLSGLEERPQTSLEVWQTHGQRLKAATVFDPEALSQIGRSIIRFASSKRNSVTVNQYVERVLRNHPDSESATLWYTTDRWRQATRQAELDRRDIEVLYVDGAEGERLLLSIENATHGKKPHFQLKRIDDGDASTDDSNETAQATEPETRPNDATADILKKFASQVLGSRVAEIAITSFEPTIEAARLVRPPLPQEMRQHGPMIEEFSRVYSVYRRRSRDEWPEQLREMFEDASRQNVDLEQILEDQLATVSRRRLLLNWNCNDVRRVAALASQLTGQSSQEHKLFDALVEQFLLSARVGSGEPMEGQELVAIQNSANRFVTLALDLVDTCKPESASS